MQKTLSPPRFRCQSKRLISRCFSVNVIVRRVAIDDRDGAEHDGAVTDSLAHRIAVDVRGRDFVGKLTSPDGHVYGGQLVAQATSAAVHGVPEGQLPHAVHARFVGRGDAALPVHYSVEEIATGRSFSSRLVTGTQPGGALVVATASFHRPEDGESYQDPLPDGAGRPGDHPIGRYHSPAVETRDVAPTPGSIRRLMWFRPRHELPDDITSHVIGVIFASDHGPTRAVREPHAGHPGVERRMSVSLDHAVWVHRATRFDGWMLSCLEARSTADGRGMTTGTIHTADGIHVATVAQEVVLRLPGGGSRPTEDR